MDYFNNDKGRKLGSQAWFVWTVDDKIMDGMKGGEFLYIKNNQLVWSNK
jgi:hypothetical protein